MAASAAPNFDDDATALEGTGLGILGWYHVLRFRDAGDAEEVNVVGTRRLPRETLSRGRGVSKFRGTLKNLHVGRTISSHRLCGVTPTCTCFVMLNLNQAIPGMVKAQIVVQISFLSSSLVVLFVRSSATY